MAALLVLGAFFLATGLPRHDRFENARLPDCLPQTVDSNVVANLNGPVLTGPSSTDGAGGLKESANVDDSTEAIARCAQTARDFLDDYDNVIFAGAPSWPGRSNTAPTASYGPTEPRDCGGRQQ